MGKMWKQCQILFCWVQNQCWWWLQPRNEKTFTPWKNSFVNPRHFADKGPYSQGYVFSSTHVWMWKLDHKEGWALKTWRFQTVVLEKTLESPLDFREIQPVHPKRNQSWIFIGRIDAEAETPIDLPPDAKNWLIWKDPVAGKDWMWEEKGTTEDEMLGWHHRLNGHEFEQALGIGVGQWSLASMKLQSTGSQRVGHDWATELN